MLYRRTTYTLDGYAALELSGSLYMPENETEAFKKLERVMSNILMLVNELEHIMNEGDDDAKGYTLMRINEVDEAVIMAQMDIQTGPPQEVK
jgi:hypothetical protein